MVVHGRARGGSQLVRMLAVVLPAAAALATCVVESEPADLLLAGPRAQLAYEHLGLSGAASDGDERTQFQPRDRPSYLPEPTDRTDEELQEYTYTTWLTASTILSGPGGIHPLRAIRSVSFAFDAHGRLFERFHFWLTFRRAER